MAGDQAADKPAARQPGGDGFETLTAALEAFFERSFDNLPPDLQIMWAKRVPHLSWDSCSPGQRRDAALQNDYSRDPAYDFEGDFWFDLTGRKVELARERIEEFNAPAKEPVAKEMRDIRLARIDLELREIANEETEITAIAPTERRAAMIRIRGQWEKRDKNATRQLAGLPSIESPAQPAAGETCRPSHAASEAETQSARTPYSETNGDIYHTGVAGRPTSKNLILCEMLARGLRGELSTTLADEARQLRAWLKSTHPGAPQLAEKSIKNALRGDFRKCKAS